MDKSVIKKPTKKEIRDTLWARGELRWILHGVQREMYDNFQNTEKNSISVWLVSRQLGKCIEENTLVSTPTGVVKIKDLNVDDLVYGYNMDGTIAPTKVLAVECQGEKEVVDLLNHNRKVATATEDHRFLVCDTLNNKLEEKTVRELDGSHLKIVRSFINTPMGNINEPNAYSHQEIIDLNIIRTWNRESCIKLLAGILDREGSLQVTGGDKLKISFYGQSTNIVECIKFLGLSLFQAEFCILKDDTLCLNTTFLVEKILKELDPYLVLEHKKWKPEYEFFRENNLNPNLVGVNQGSRYLANTYDIQVDNETNLYVLGNGLITHNSWLLTVLAIEHAMKNPNSVIKLVTDTKAHVKSIFEPLFRDILLTCPEDFKPKYNTSQFLYHFPNGSQVQLAGSDNKNYERLRGQRASLILVDEAGFCNDLNDMVYSVLLPTTTHTGGKIILSSTPPEDSAHPFLNFIEEATMNGTLTKKTIFDNPLLSKEQIDNIITKMGGITSERFRREYLVQIVKSADSSVIPEFTEELQKEIIKEWPLPPFYDTYVSMDLGGKDLTAVLFGYYDFRADKIIIQDELIMDFRKPGNNIEELTKQIMLKEEQLWTNVLTNELKKPYLRVSDVNPMVLNEIRKYSHTQLTFVATKKDNVDAYINNLRALLSAKKIIINPKCKILIRHLANVRWKGSTKDEFARSVDNGHYDAADACIYLIRNIVFGKNPYPSHYDYSMKDLFVANPSGFNQSNNNQTEILKKIFSPSKRKW